MLQIRTIRDTNAARFDYEVNNALMNGWTLTRRYTVREDFVAEMEMEVITEAEKCCENCKHCELPENQEPCYSCSQTCSEWEAAE